MKKSWLIIIGILVLLCLVFISLYNGLVNASEDIQNRWAQVETNYQRRADLIPNLVNTVKGYASHESETFNKIAELRSGYANASTPQEYTQLDNNLRTAINIAVENYPDLKANQNFLSLQDELAGTENRINIARQDYNNAVTKYNKKLRYFPTNIIANMFGFEKEGELFEAQQGTENAPTVDFE